MLWCDFNVPTIIIVLISLCQYTVDIMIDNVLLYLSSEDGKPLSKKALKKQAKQLKKDERKAQTAAKLVMTYQSMQYWLIF